MSAVIRYGSNQDGEAWCAADIEGRVLGPVETFMVWVGIARVLTRRLPPGSISHTVVCVVHSLVDTMSKAHETQR